MCPQDFWIAAEDGNVAKVSELIATGVAVDTVQTDDSYELSGLADRNRDQVHEIRTEVTLSW